MRGSRKSGVLLGLLLHILGGLEGQKEQELGEDGRIEGGGGLANEWAKASSRL